MYYFVMCIEPAYLSKNNIIHFFDVPGIGTRQAGSLPTEVLSTDT